MCTWIKRTVPVFLVLALCITCLVSPAAATSFDPDYEFGLNVLDYSVSDDGDNSKSTGSEGTAQFIYQLPSASVYRYIDILVSTSDGTLSEVYAGRTGYAIDSSGKNKLTVRNFGTHMYRIYGSIPARNYKDFEINFIANKSSCVINILSIKLRNTKVGYYNEVGSLSVADWQGSHSYTQSAYDGVCTHTIPAGSGGNAQLTAVAALNCSNWRNYDYLEFYGGSMNTSFASISVICDGLSIPYSVSYFGDPVQDALDSATAMRYFIISLDLRGIDRSTSSFPQINITFTYPESQSASILISKVHGVVNETNIDPQLYFLRNILDSLQTGFFSVVSAVDSAKTAIVNAIEGISIEVDSIDYSSLLLNIQGSLMGINTSLNGWFEDLIETSSGNNLILGNLYRDLPDLFDIIQNALADIDDQLISQFDEFEVVFKSQLEGLRSQITTLSGNLNTWFTNLQTSVTNSISAFQQVFIDQIDDLEESLFHKLDNIRGEILVFKGTFEQWMASLQGLLRDAFGLEDDYIDDANQTQEEVNVSINNQLVGAVEDWNANIEVVETGYGLAVTKATPALHWLGTLADRIFVNMGWFASIYFLIGLVSVLMLILSKSGLSRSIGAAARRK